MRIKAATVTVLAMVCFFCSLAGAFPLTGGPAEKNVTVVGVISHPGEAGYKTILVDTILRNVSPNLISAAFVDTESNYYYDKSKLDLKVGEVKPSNPANRMYLKFEIPTDAIIKKLVIQPEREDPIEIEWDSIPVLTLPTAKIEILGTTETEEGITKTKIYDIRITNTGNKTVALKDFYWAIDDSIGWRYYLGIWEEDSMVKLLPGSSIKTAIGRSAISALSEITELTCILYQDDRWYSESVNIIGFS